MRPFIILASLLGFILLITGSTFACGLKVFEVAPLDAYSWATIYAAAGLAGVLAYISSMLTEWDE